MKIFKSITISLILLFSILFTPLHGSNVFAATAVGVTYETHVQNQGWQGPVSNGALSGTEGRSLRLEGIMISLLDAPVGARISYKVHVQNIGWQAYTSGVSGTTGQSLRLEAIHIKLENLPGYSVQYRVHVQNVGWQGWKADDALAGTTGLGLRLEAIEIKIVSTYTPVLAVKSVTSISKSGVVLALTAPTADVLAASVLVKDSLGNTIAVTPKTIAAGETTATFGFVSNVSDSALTGIWTVDGVAINLSAINQLGAIKTAAAGANQVNLNSALLAGGITGVNTNYLVGYKNAIVDADVTHVPSTFLNTLADVQTLVNKVNATNATTTSDDAKALAVKDAGANQVALLTALQANFLRVNPAWIVDYDSVLNGTEDAAQIQKDIDQLDFEKLDIAYQSAWTTMLPANVAAAKSLVTLYAKDGVIYASSTVDTPVTATNTISTKIMMLDEIAIMEALVNVRAATTNLTLKSALVNLAALETLLIAKYEAILSTSTYHEHFHEEFDIKTVNDALLTDYKTFIAAASSPLNRNQRSDIKTLVDAANSTALTTALNELNALTTSSTATVVKAALQKLATYTSQSEVGFDMTKVVDALLEDYLTHFVADTTNYTNAIDVNTVITHVNVQVDREARLASNLAILKSTTATLAQVRDALIEISAYNAPVNNGLKYLNATPQVKLEVAQFIVTNSSVFSGTSLTYDIVTTDTGTGYNVAMLKTAFAAHDTKLAAFNSIGLLSATDTVTINTKLTAYGLVAPVNELTVLDSYHASFNIRQLTKVVNDAPVSLNFSGDDAVKTIAEANAIIAAAIAKP